MKKISSLFAVLTLSLMFFSCGQTSEPKKNSFDIKNGINVGGWLSQSKKIGEDRKAHFTRSDVEYIANLGYDHIRIPIDEEQMFDENGLKNMEAFALLHSALGWCDEFNLRTVVDLHILRSHHFADTERPLFTDTNAQEQFFECWRKISEELSKYSVDKVAYEPLNEPVANDHENWNKVLNRCVEVIRELEPERTVVIGSNEWSHWDTMKFLRVPENDPNIIISFHYYKPQLFTHYGSWLYSDDPITVPVHYPGQTIADTDLDAAKDYAMQGKMIYNIEVIESNLMEVIEFAQKYNLKLYCGEYGCMNTVAEEDRIQWIKDVNTLFVQHGIARANWNYDRGGMGIFLHTGKPDTKLINAIFGKKQVNLLQSY